MGLFSSGGGNQMKSAAKKATKAIGFTPPDVALSGVGSVGYTIDPYKGITGVNLSPDQQLLSNQQQLYGLGGANLGAAGAFTAPTQQAGLGLLSAGQQALGQLGSFDPAQLAQERYNALQGILAPQDVTNQSALESRLLAQGRLDSTGGGAQLKAYYDSLNQRNAGLLDQAYNESQQAQQNLGNLGINLTGQGAQFGSGLFARGVQGIAAGGQALNPLYQLLNLSTGIGAQDLAGQQAKAAAIGNYNAAQAQEGGGFLSNLLPAVATGLGTAFGGPLGGLAGSAIGGLFTSGGTQTPMSSAPLTTSVPNTNGAAALFGIQP